MKTFKFHIRANTENGLPIDLQFERSSDSPFLAKTKALFLVRQLGLDIYTAKVLWQEEVANDESDSFCARNPINSDGFINWEDPKMSVAEIIELKMESIEEHRNANS